MSKKIIVDDLENSKELTEDAANQIKGGAVAKIPTLHKISDVTLKRGSTDSAFEAWPSKWKISSFDGKGNNQ